MVATSVLTYFACVVPRVRSAAFYLNFVAVTVAVYVALDAALSVRICDFCVL